MKPHKDDKLKRLIQQIESDQPTAGFTKNLMKQIETQDSLVINTALQTLLNQNTIESLSVDFTERVMSGITRLDRKIVYEPVISKKAWYSIGIAATFILTLASVFGKSSQTTGRPSTNDLTHFTGQVIAQINSLPVVFLASSFAIVLLLLLDYFAGFGKKYQL